jgi:hypothetical protein
MKRIILITITLTLVLFFILVGGMESCYNVQLINNSDKEVVVILGETVSTKNNYKSEMNYSYFTYNNDSKLIKMSSAKDYAIFSVRPNGVILQISEGMSYKFFIDYMYIKHGDKVIVFKNKKEIADAFDDNRDGCLRYFEIEN